MPPFFTYRSIDALREDIARRGHAIELADDARALAAALHIGPLTLANRLAVHPMEGCDGNLDGTPGELTFRRWRRFAEGGAALLWGEATAVVPEARANPRQLLISARDAAGTAAAARRDAGGAQGPLRLDRRVCRRAAAHALGALVAPRPDHRAA